MRFCFPLENASYAPNAFTASSKPERISVSVGTVPAVPTMPMFPVETAAPAISASARTWTYAPGMTRLSSAKLSAIHFLLSCLDR